MTVITMVLYKRLTGKINVMLTVTLLKESIYHYYYYSANLCTLSAYFEFQYTFSTSALERLISASALLYASVAFSASLNAFSYCFSLYKQI